MHEISENDKVCKNCEHLMFSDCYGECIRGYLGIVQPWDSCEHFERRHPYNKHRDIHTEH